MPTAQNRAALTAAVEAWNAGDGDGYLALYDPGIVHHGLAPEPFDAAANRGFYEALWAAVPGSQLVVDDTVAEGRSWPSGSTRAASTRASSWGSPPPGGRSC